MKKSITASVAIFLSIVCILCFVACDQDADTTALWENATYSSDTTLGNGEKTVLVSVEAGEKSIVLTLNTDKNNLGDAMYEHGLINDPTFFNVLNGIEASWKKDQAYWAFYEGDTIMPYGVNDQRINGGESFRFVYTK